MSIVTSSATDPYQPAEAKFKLTRACLEAFVDYPPGLLVIQTRSPIVERDFDLIGRLGPCAWLSMTIETDDEQVREAITPGVPRISRRQAVVEADHRAGIQTQVTVSPLPGHPPPASLQQLAEPTHPICYRRYLHQRRRRPGQTNGAEPIAGAVRGRRPG